MWPQEMSSLTKFLHKALLRVRVKAPPKPLVLSRSQYLKAIQGPVEWAGPRKPEEDVCFQVDIDVPLACHRYPVQSK